jgi:hypothetical protein
MDLCSRGSIGKKDLNRTFKPDTIKGCRTIMGVCSWQQGLQHLQRGGSTTKKDLNRVFKPDKHSGCRIVVVDVGDGMKGGIWKVELHSNNKTMGYLYHLSSLWGDRRDMLKRNGNMQHIFVTYRCRDKWIVIEKSWSIKHAWMNCNGRENNRGRWNIKLICLKCNDGKRDMQKRKGNMQHIYVICGCKMMHKGKLIMIKKSYSMKHMSLKCVGCRRNKDRLIMIEKPYNIRMMLISNSRWMTCWSWKMFYRS